MSSAKVQHEALGDVAGGMEGYEPFDAVAGAVERAREARDTFARAARAGLRHGGQVAAIDRRPRHFDDASTTSD